MDQTQRHHRRGGRQHLRATATSPGSCGRTARRGSPPGRLGDRAGSASAAPITSSARLAELVRDAIPAAARRTGGHPGQTHVPGAAHRGERRARRARAGAAGGARRAGAGRPDGGAVVPLAGGPARQAGAGRRGPAVTGTGRPAGRAARYRTRRCGCSPAARSRRARRRSRPTRGRRRSGCGRPSVTIPTAIGASGRQGRPRTAPPTDRAPTRERHRATGRRGSGHHRRRKHDREGEGHKQWQARPR